MKIVHFKITPIHLNISSPTSEEIQLLYSLWNEIFGVKPKGLCGHICVVRILQFFSGMTFPASARFYLESIKNSTLCWEEICQQAEKKWRAREQRPEEALGEASFKARPLFQPDGALVFGSEPDVYLANAFLERYNFPFRVDPVGGRYPLSLMSFWICANLQAGFPILLSVKQSKMHPSLIRKLFHSGVSRFSSFLPHLFLRKPVAHTLLIVGVDNEGLYLFDPYLSTKPMIFWSQLDALLMGHPIIPFIPDPSVPQLPLVWMRSRHSMGDFITFELADQIE
ncbi:hypothetical protein J7L13_00345 [bacterium]|nr:hypothetical protein [bacterium]